MPWYIGPFFGYLAGIVMMAYYCISIPWADGSSKWMLKNVSVCVLMAALWPVTIIAALVFRKKVI